MNNEIKTFKYRKYRNKFPPDLRAIIFFRGGSYLEDIFFLVYNLIE